MSTCLIQAKVAAKREMSVDDITIMVLFIVQHLNFIITYRCIC